MRAGRLLSILIALQLRGRVSARQMALEFEVSKRTIYRDVEELSASGVPIYATRGADGGFELLDGWQTRLTGMTAGEAEALIFANVPHIATELGLGSAAAAAQLKFLASLPTDTSDAARRVAERFHLDPAPWYTRPTTLVPTLRILAKAVWESRKIRINYRSWQGASVRSLEPLGIVLKAGEWYFLAIRRGRPSIHRVSSIAHLELQPESFKRPRQFDLAKTWKDSVADYETRLRRGKAVLRIKPRALAKVDRLDSDMSEPILKATPNRSGDREVIVAIESIEHAASMLMPFGDDIEVLEPDALRKELGIRAQAILNLYCP
jgi:predicted DNA-binding transcriptional regulator YafY